MVVYKQGQTMDSCTYQAIRGLIKLGGKKMESITTTLVTKISMADIETTYNGEQGCACGCGGDYFTPAENLEIATKRLNKINARLKSKPSDVENGHSYLSLEGATRATRVYLIKGITYRFNYTQQQLVREERIEAN